ncbi:MAG: hypothetical protein IKE43_12385 [Coriobacteriales bacterium]|nr:hypothetical protein [Coriobacteriales bacterium]
MDGVMGRVREKLIMPWHSMSDSLQKDAGVIYIILALGIIGTWTNLVGYSGAFLHANDNSRLAYQVGSLGCALFFVFAPNLVLKTERVTCVAIPIMMSLCTILYGLAYYQQLFDSFSMSLICCSLLGISYMWFVLTLYTHLARRTKMPLAITAIVSAAILEQVVATVLTVLLNDLWQVIVCVALPGCSIACLFKARNVHYKEPKRVLCSGSAEKYLLLLIFAVGMAVSVLSRTSTIGYWGTVRVDYNSPSSILTTLIACVFLALISWFSISKFVSKPLTVKYQPAFLVIIAGYAFGVFMPKSITFEPVVALGLALEFYGHVIRWVIAVDAVQQLRFQQYRVMGLSLLIGPTASILWGLLGLSSTAIGAIVLIAAYLVVLVITVLPSVANHLNAHANPEEDAPQEPIAPALVGDPQATGQILMESVRNRCVFLAREYGLTTRETEVFELLVCGKTRSLIQEELILSESTVKTHIKHIYAKFEVITITELMAIVFNEQ